MEAFSKQLLTNSSNLSWSYLAVFCYQHFVPD